MNHQQEPIFNHLLFLGINLWAQGILAQAVLNLGLNLLKFTAQQSASQPSSTLPDKLLPLYGNNMIETFQDYKNQYNSLTPPASSWLCHYLLASTMKPSLWPFAQPIACKGTCSSLPASCIWSLLSSSPWRPYSTFLSRSSFFSALLLPCTVSILFPALETSVLLSKTLSLTDLFLITQDYAATRCCEIILSPIFFSPLAKERLAY